MMTNNCPHCGGAKTHDTEQLSPHTHCTCPRGPLWDWLAISPLGKELGLIEAEERYPKLEAGKVAWKELDDGQFYWTTADQWRQLLIHNLEAASD
jgi:hypothetical protein